MDPSLVTGSTGSPETGLEPGVPRRLDHQILLRNSAAAPEQFPPKQRRCQQYEKLGGGPLISKAMISGFEFVGHDLSSRNGLRRLLKLAKTGDLVKSRKERRRYPDMDILPGPDKVYRVCILPTTRGSNRTGLQSPRPYQDLIQELLDEEGLSASKRINLDRLQYRYWVLNAVQWKLAFSMDIAAVPNIPAVHLKKLDGGGALVKALAMGQVLYLIVQLISRKVQGLPSSQLEIATLAFSVLSLFTYLSYVGIGGTLRT
ncbi:hypothetical protein M434DRAFT_16044 [Hypoxylon sp. CO27-5]|nr:hypothetical protein M434DRAFT_16044 [Hypoxylon sp. CO27-5]